MWTQGQILKLNSVTVFKHLTLGNFLSSFHNSQWSGFGRKVFSKEFIVDKLNRAGTIYCRCILVLNVIKPKALYYSLAVAGAGSRAEILLKPAVTVDWWPAAAAVLFRILLCCTPPPEFKTSQIFIRSHGNCRLHPIFSTFKTFFKIKTFCLEALSYLPYQCVSLLGQLQDGKVD